MIASSKLDLNSKNVKSYATKESLASAIKRADVEKLFHVVAMNESGRYVAIFVGADALQLAVCGKLPGVAVVAS